MSDMPTWVWLMIYKTIGKPGKMYNWFFMPYLSLPWPYKPSCTKISNLKAANWCKAKISMQKFCHKMSSQTALVLIGGFISFLLKLFYPFCDMINCFGLQISLSTAILYYYHYRNTGWIGTAGWIGTRTCKAFQSYFFPH